MSAAAPAGPSALARLWRLWPYARADRGLLVGAAACMLLLGAATGAYAYLSGPALRFLLTGGEQGLSGLARVLPGLAHMDRERWRWLLPALIVAIAALKGLAYCGQFFSMGLFGHRVGLSLRRALFSRLCDLSPIQLTAQRQGDLLSRLSADVAAVETAANYAVGTYMRDGVQVVVLVGVALALEWRIALVAIVLVPLAVLPASRLTKSFLRRTREAQATLGVMAAQVQEGVQGIRTLQAFDAREAELARFDAQARVQLRAQQKANWARAAVPGLMELFAAVAISFAFLAAYGAKGDAAERFVSLLYALVLLYQPAKQLGRVGQMALAAAVSTERLLQLLELPRWVEDPPSPAPLPRLARGIELKDVAYSYGDRPALRGVSLTLPVGKVTALVGPSGSGKSTLTALLLRQARPSRGEILVDGVDVERAAVDAVRAQFALVTQEPLLFAATVRENLLLARPGASETELRRAAALAQADGFLSALPKGYDTPLGERGVRLSGGQKQRLALARALLADAPVLILDEATSSLDPESEREVQAALAAVLPGRTALVIAHRLSTVADADVVHVLQEGRVVESGTRTALLQQGGLFAQLWRLQHAGGRVKALKALMRLPGPRLPASWLAKAVRAVLGLVLVVFGYCGFFALAASYAHYPLVPGGPPAQLRGAYHIHSTRSDGRAEPAEIAAAAKAAGLQFVVLTDHNPPDARPPEFVDGVLLIHAAELSTPVGHLVALGLPRALTAPEREQGAVQLARSLGASTFLAHPIQQKRPWTDWEAATAATGLELYSADSMFRDAQRHPLSRFLPAVGAYLTRPVQGLLTVVVPQPEATERLLSLSVTGPKVALCAHDAHGLPPYQAEFETLSMYLPASLGKSLPTDAAAARALVLTALASGEAYCGFHALAEASGFDVQGMKPGRQAQLGQTLKVVLPASTPPSARVEVRGPGKVLADGRTVQLDGAGAVLVEVWVEAPGRFFGSEWKPWIIGSPVQVVP